VNQSPLVKKIGTQLSIYTDKSSIVGSYMNLVKVAFGRNI